MSKHKEWSEEWMIEMMNTATESYTTSLEKETARGDIFIVSPTTYQALAKMVKERSQSFNSETEELHCVMEEDDD